MKRLLITAILALLPLIFYIPQTDAQAPSPDPVEVQKCIERAIGFLYGTQDGNQWPDYSLGREYQGATTAVAVLALLNAGEEPNKAEINDALSWIERTPTDEGRTTYGVSVRIMALLAADPNKQRFGRIIDQDVKWLIDNQTLHGTRAGGWGYTTSSEYSDNSLSQFALLALHEAAQAGNEIPEQTWRRANEYWQNSGSRSNGGYGYIPGNTSSGSMTCAAISSLTILAENLLTKDAFLNDGGVDCCKPMEDNSATQRAIRWMTQHFQVTTNPSGAGDHKFYYLYGLERAARLSGLRFFGNNDWYRLGTAHLLQQQARDGSFTGQFPGDKASTVINTSFSLLFLAKGLRPILFGKYQYAEQNSEWDLHPTGIHFLTHETEKAWDIPMTWQTIRATDATANDLREAPILFLSGKDALVLDQQQKLALKDYIENGGFVVAEACQGDGCGANVPFDTSFRALMTELFPESKLEPIAENHPIWNANFPIKPNPGWPLLGLQTCCRTSVIYSPRSLSCYWQMDRPNLLKQFDKSIADEIIEIRKLGINIAAYATGRELLQRLSRPKLAEQSSVVLDDRVLTYPRLIPASLTDDAPNAWKNVLRELSASTQFTVSQGKKTLPADFEQMANFPFLFMHGREQFELQPSERAAIKKYVELGNMLFVDSICASDAFSKSFEKEIETIFPGQLKDIPSNHSIWTRQFGSDLSRVELRRPDPTAPNGVLLESTHPQLKGIEIDGRFVLIYSPFDISCAMENAAANQCRGYSKKDAAAIAINVLLYALLVD